MGFVVHTSAFTAQRSAIFLRQFLGGNLFNIYFLIIANLYLFTLNYQLEAHFYFKILIIVVCYNNQQNLTEYCCIF